MNQQDLLMDKIWDIRERERERDLLHSLYQGVLVSLWVACHSEQTLTMQRRLLPLPAGPTVCTG